MSRKSQRDWIDGAVVALSKGGIDAVRVEPLAKALGVSKGSFYHHFENRRALQLALLDQWEHLGTSAIIDETDRASSEPAEQLAALVRIACSPDPLGDPAETAIRAWAASDEAAQLTVARVDQRRLDYVTAMLVRTGMTRALAKRRATMFYRVIIGDSTWRMAGGPKHTAADFKDLTALLLST